MLAARYYGKRDIRIEEVAEPSIGAPDDVLIEVSWCGICGTDLHEYTVGPIVIPTMPHPLTKAQLPQILGHELSGTVVEVGGSVRSVAPGDRVAVMPAIICGHCDYCRAGLGHLCESFACTGLSSHSGGLARYAVVKEYQVSPLPESVTDLEGALVEPASVAAHGIDLAKVSAGDVVLVTGAGPIGSLAALYAAACGAAAVIISEPNPARAARARALDVGPVVDPRGGELEDLLKTMTRGLGADVGAECSGTSAGLSSALDNVRRGGRIVQLGLHTAPATIDAMLLAQKEVSYIGSWCYLVTSWPRMIRLMASRKLDVSRIVTSQISLTGVVEDGFEKLIDPTGDQIKVLVSPRPDAVSER